VPGGGASYPAAHAAAPAVGLDAVRAYLELTKPVLTMLVLVTTGLGYLLGSTGPVDVVRLVLAVLGTALVGGGANGLNQWWETGRDARMVRTRGRPFPSRRITSRGGFVFSVAISVLGAALLFAFVNTLTATLSLVSWAVYLFAYTPLKPRTTLNTLVGAVSGAIPPVMGWAAAAGRLDAGALVLFAILFIWQIPHFLAIAWIHRADYEGGGFRMLPVVDPAGRATFRIAVVYCVGLIPVAWTAALVGLSGWIYLAGSTLLGLILLAQGLHLYRTRTVEAARALFLGSVVMLPALLLLMLADPTRLRGF
jgi:protoheme IX farnesyltransferase